MYYFEKFTVKAAFDALKNNVENKFLGVLGILKSIDSDSIVDNRTYSFDDGQLASWLDETCYLDTFEGKYGDSKLYVKFSKQWKDYIKENFIKSSISIYSLITFLYKFEGFSEEPTYNDLLVKFCKDFHISKEIVLYWFTDDKVNISFTKTPITKSACKSLLEVKTSTLSFISPFSLAARAGELSRAPFVQTLYAGMDSIKCLLILKDDIDLYYNTLNSQNPEKERSLSAIPESFKTYTPVLRTKPFLLLAGISGTGKSRIVREMAFASCPDVDALRKDEVSPGNYLLVEVKPNWHDSTELMGYESSIRKTYVLTPFIKFLYKAMRYPNIPFFVCLDEMNLAPVEQYFAEFLSVLESRQKMDDGLIVSDPLIKPYIFSKYEDLEKELKNGEDYDAEEDQPSILETTELRAMYQSKEYASLCEHGLCIPQNVIVVGTVNMDETTHQFSRKVIDRAMTIEMNEVKFADFFKSNSELGYVSNPLPASVFLSKYTSANQALDDMPNDASHIKKHLPKMLEELNTALNNTPFKIAYRVQNEIVLYLSALREDNRSEDISILLNTAFDDIMLMKVLPRIEGDAELLGKPLKSLLTFSENFTRSNRKIQEMLARLETDHFTSFWP